MIKSALITAALLVTALSGICQAEDTIRINGSGSALDMMKPMIAAYKKINQNVRIDMEKPLGSSGAIKALVAGALDIAVSSKQLKPDEAALGAQLKEYGTTPLALITENTVPLSNITTKELEDIYAGRMTEWKNREKIRVILRPQEDIDTKILRGLSPHMNTAIAEVQSHPGMIVAITDPESNALVAKTPGGLGATGLTSIIVEKLPVNILSLNGVKPTPKALADKTYPLAKEISFVSTARTSPAAMKFLTFVYSSQGRAIDEKAGVLVIAKPEAGGR
jgi:phosphate transport system substrate-binding protein